MDADSRKGVSFFAALYRTIVKLLPWELAHLGNNLPEPIWYADNPEFRVCFLFSGLLMAVYVVAVFASASGQGIHDRLSRTMVVRIKCND